MSKLQTVKRGAFLWCGRGRGGSKPNACKTDLAMESPRLWFWENRLTLLLMVSLLYSFLLSLLHPHCQPPVEGLLRNWCHRTGKRYRDAAIPLPTIRSALSALWLAYPPPLSPCTQNSG